MAEQPLYIRVHPEDNVAIVVNGAGLPAGTEFSDGLTLREHVPQGHKVNLVDLAEGAPILRYGQVIGNALVHALITPAQQRGTPSRRQLGRPRLVEAPPTRAEQRCGHAACRR